MSHWLAASKRDCTQSSSAVVVLSPAGGGAEASPLVDDPATMTMGKSVRANKNVMGSLKYRLVAERNAEEVEMLEKHRVMTADYDDILAESGSDFDDVHVDHYARREFIHSMPLREKRMREMHRCSMWAAMVKHAFFMRLLTAQKRRFGALMRLKRWVRSVILIRRARRVAGLRVAQFDLEVRPTLKALLQFFPWLKLLDEMLEPLPPEAGDNKLSGSALMTSTIHRRRNNDDNPFAVSDDKSKERLLTVKLQAPYVRRAFFPPPSSHQDDAKRQKTRYDSGARSGDGNSATDAEAVETKEEEEEEKEEARPQTLSEIVAGALLNKMLYVTGNHLTNVAERAGPVTEWFCLGEGRIAEIEDPNQEVQDFEVDDVAVNIFKRGATFGGLLPLPLPSPQGQLLLLGTTTRMWRITQQQFRETLAEVFDMGGAGVGATMMNKTMTTMTNTCGSLPHVDFSLTGTTTTTTAAAPTPTSSAAYSGIAAYQLHLQQQATARSIQTVLERATREQLIAKLHQDYAVTPKLLQNVPMLSNVSEFALSGFCADVVKSSEPLALRGGDVLTTAGCLSNDVYLVCGFASLLARRKVHSHNAGASITIRGGGGGGVRQMFRVPEWADHRIEVSADVWSLVGADELVLPRVSDMTISIIDERASATVLAPLPAEDTRPWVAAWRFDKASFQKLIFHDPMEFVEQRRPVELAILGRMPRVSEVVVQAKMPLFKLVPHGVIAQHIIPRLQPRMLSGEGENVTSMPQQADGIYLVVHGELRRRRYGGRAAVSAANNNKHGGGGGGAEATMTKVAPDGAVVYDCEMCDPSTWMAMGGAWEGAMEYLPPPALRKGMAELAPNERWIANWDSKWFVGSSGQLLLWFLPSSDLKDAFRTLNIDQKKRTVASAIAAREAAAKVHPQVISRVVADTAAASSNIGARVPSFTNGPATVDALSESTQQQHQQQRLGSSSADVLLLTSAASQRTKSKMMSSSLRRHQPQQSPSSSLFPASSPVASFNYLGAGGVGGGGGGGGVSNVFGSSMMMSTATAVGDDDDHHQQHHYHHQTAQHHQQQHDLFFGASSSINLAASGGNVITMVDDHHQHRAATDINNNKNDNSKRPFIVPIPPPVLPPKTKISTVARATLRQLDRWGIDGFDNEHPKEPVFVVPAAYPPPPRRDDTTTTTSTEIMASQHQGGGNNTIASAPTTRSSTVAVRLHSPPRVQQALKKRPDTSSSSPPQVARSPSPQRKKSDNNNNNNNNYRDGDGDGVGGGGGGEQGEDINNKTGFHHGGRCRKRPRPPPPSSASRSFGDGGGGVDASAYSAATLLHPQQRQRLLTDADLGVALDDHKVHVADQLESLLRRSAAAAAAASSSMISDNNNNADSNRNIVMKKVDSTVIAVINGDVTTTGERDWPCPGPDGTAASVSQQQRQQQQHHSLSSVTVIPSCVKYASRRQVSQRRIEELQQHNSANNHTNYSSSQPHKQQSTLAPPFLSKNHNNDHQRRTSSSSSTTASGASCGDDDDNGDNNNHMTASSVSCGGGAGDNNTTVLLTFQGKALGRLAVPVPPPSLLPAASSRTPRSSGGGVDSSSSNRDNQMRYSRPIVTEHASNADFARFEQCMQKIAQKKAEKREKRERRRLQEEKRRRAQRYVSPTKKPRSEPSSPLPMALSSSFKSMTL